MSLEAIRVVIHQTMNKLGGLKGGWGGVLNFKERYPEKNYVLSNSKKIVQIYQRMYKFLERFVKFIGKQASQVLNFIHIITTAIQKGTTIEKYQAKGSSEENVAMQKMGNEYETKLEPDFLIASLLISMSGEQCGL